MPPPCKRNRLYYIIKNDFSKEKELLKRWSKTDEMLL